MALTVRSGSKATVCLQCHLRKSASSNSADSEPLQFRTGKAMSALGGMDAKLPQEVIYGIQVNVKTCYLIGGSKYQPTSLVVFTPKPYFKRQYPTAGYIYSLVILGPPAASSSLSESEINRATLCETTGPEAWSLAWDFEPIMFLRVATLAIREQGEGPCLE